MGQPLTEYEHALRKRLEVVRKREKLKQKEMASCMGVSEGRYKRFAYGEAKIPPENIAMLMESRPIDIDYLLRGKTVGKARIMSNLLGSSNEEKAEFFMDLARMYREMDEREKIDYSTDKGLLIEGTNPRKHNKDTKQ